MDEPILKLAADLPSRDLGTLDAIQLATALSIGDLPEAFVTYDRRLAKAARRHGLHVVHPKCDRGIVGLKPDPARAGKG